MHYTELAEGTKSPRVLATNFYKVSGGARKANPPREP